MLVERIVFEALQHIDAERLIAAPDCGRGRERALATLRNLSAAAQSL